MDNNTRHVRRTAFVMAALAVTAGLSLAWGSTTGMQQQPGAAALHDDALGQDESGVSLLSRVEWRELNLHKHGIGLRAERSDGFLDRSAARRVLVVDLGPDIPYLQEDIPPVMAEITVNGQGPLAFDMVLDGILQAQVPAEWISIWSDNEVRIQVWGPFGQEIVDFSGEIPGLL